MVERNLEALNGVADPLAAANREMGRLIAEMNAAATDAAKADLAVMIQVQRERVEKFRGNFLDIVGGAEAAGYDEVKQAERTLQDQFSDLLDPLVGALREPTEKLRQTEQLRKDLLKWQDRYASAGSVIERIDRLAAKATDEQVKSGLAEARRLWESRRSDATGNIEVLKLQVEERERTTPTVWESMSRMFRNFWATRGLNLLLSVAAAVAAWFLVRRGYETLLRVGPVKRTRGSFVAKAAGILSFLIAGFAALLAVLLVLFLRGDWLLLTLVVVLLISAAWAGKATLPPYIEQIKITLNLGSVREGERLIYQGLPWEVTSLGFYSVFTNPALEGGILRIPIQKVMGMISRLADGKEQWFPTHKGDWAVLADGTYGKVIHQTPEQVVLILLGGVLKTYPTTDFLEQTPENLMKGFRVTTTFGISYDCQSIATTEVASVFQEALQASLTAELGRDAIRAVKVEFAEAGTSSLDYMVLADFEGEVAQRMKNISRMLQRICVEVCNAQGWEIPFSQITVHQAGPASETGERNCPDFMTKHRASH